MTFKTIEDLYKKYSWKTASKFIPLAKRYGFSSKEANVFLKNRVVHDVKVPKAKFIPIVSKQPGGYQMDTFINQKGSGNINYLMLININTRKAYPYQMNGKGSKEVLKALHKFFDEVPNVHSITSDQDTAYLSKEVLDFLRQKNIIYHTTESNNHNILGIINRFMRTIRDIIGENRYISSDEMENIISAYNESPHKALNNKSPNDISLDDELKYIQAKTKINPYNFKPNDRVRVVLAKEPFSKRRNALSKESYKIDSRAGNQFIIKAEDHSIDKYPGYRLIEDKQQVPLAKSINKGRNGVVEKIIRYDEKKNKYKVQYEGGVQDIIPARSLREGNPIKLSPMEYMYWSTKKHVPESIKKWS